jgi:hypothetical protein
VLWNYGHCSIPRHLRDVFVNEYGIADLRGIDDAGWRGARCWRSTDERFAPALQACAGRALKLPAGEPAPALRGNSPAEVARKLAPFRAAGLLDDYPLGCDFTPVERRLAKALGWAEGRHRDAPRQGAHGAARVGEPRPGPTPTAMQRMGLERAARAGERLQARLLALARRRG